MSEKRSEIECLNLDKLEVTELERRLEMAAMVDFSSSSSSAAPEAPTDDGGDTCIINYGSQK